jgi:Protein of unknown function (DUF1573)
MNLYFFFLQEYWEPLSKSMRMKLLLFLFCLNASAAFGQLTWESTEQSFNSKPQDEFVTAKYKFTNTGKQPIKIQNVRTSCGCTTTALTKTEYAPGESGEIQARFTFAGRTGQQEKAIMVVTSDKPNSPTILRLHVNIQELVKVNPEIILWKVGDQPAPKSIHIQVAEDAPVKGVTVTSNNPGIKVKLTELKPGKEYEAEVTPDNAAQPAQATLMIQTDYPTNNPITKYAYVRIR